VSQTPRNTRTSNRYAVTLEAELRVKEGDDWTVVRTRNGSLGGCFLEGVHLPTGTRLQLRLQLPGHLVEARALVRWQDAQGAGVQFDGLRAKDVWALGKFFEARS
jgi:hypothetical protein